MTTPHEPADAVRAALQRLAAIADAYHANQLDDEARKFWGRYNEHTNDRLPETIVLYSGRGGKELLTLKDCFDARQALAALDAAPVAEPFGMFVERDDGTTEFRRTGEPFSPTARGYKATVLYAAPAAPLGNEDQIALRRYRAVTHWIGADSWDGCSACIERLRWATEADAGRDMSNDEIAVTMRDFRAVAPDVAPVAPFVLDGWKLVPLEPTDEMVNQYPGDQPIVRRWWKAMLSAAPAAPLGGGEDEADEAYEIGKRDGYMEAIRTLDKATGGDGVFKGSSFSGETVDVPAMQARIIERFTPTSTAGDPPRPSISPEEIARQVSELRAWASTSAPICASGVLNDAADTIERLALFPASGAVSERLESHANYLRALADTLSGPCRADGLAAIAPDVLKVSEDLRALLFPPVGDQGQDSSRGTRVFLASMLGWVHHWRGDVECGLKPTLESLAAAEVEIRQAMERLNG